MLLKNLFSKEEVNALIKKFHFIGEPIGILRIIHLAPKVEYSLTELGESLSPILQMMYDWGEKRIQQLQKKRRLQLYPPHLLPTLIIYLQYHSTLFYQYPIQFFLKYHNV
ncbi:winged helix-turn-helix transcriptional regulator [Bacillus pseudomycoides]|uniref:winged helix-turn-helix transcriptional regulator n=1 Tax=Bacillus pseudomycoides TaxID=64104 RepID=UPI0037C0746F